MKFFTAEDFRELLIPPYDEKAANIANQKLQREAKVVYGEVVHGEFLWNHTSEYGDTHRALLICVEEIEKKHCEHEPVTIYKDANGFTTEAICYCGVKLKATWSVADE